MRLKYQSPAEKIYWYHLVGMKTSEMNNELDIWSISHVLEKYGLPSNNGNNRGKLEYLKTDEVKEDIAIEVIREWIEQIASVGDEFYGTDLGFDNLSRYFEDNYKTVENNYELRDESENIEPPGRKIDSLSDDEDDDVKPIHANNFIKEIELSNFKKITNVRLKLSNINCLVGRNNSGKSSILQSLHFFLSLFKSNKVGPSNEKSLVNYNDLVYVPGGSLDSLNRCFTTADGELKSHPSSLRVEYERGEKLNISTSTHVSEPDVPEKNLCIDLIGSTQEIVNMYLESDQVSTVLVPGISGISDLEEMKVLPLVNELAAKGDSNSVLRNILYEASQMGDLWLDLLDKLSEIYGKEYSIEVFPKKTDIGYYIEANLKLSDPDNKTINEYIPLSSVGTGFLQVLQILSYINVYKPKLLFLDEPDSHLHPDIQKKLIEVITQLSLERKFQIIIATHSTHVLNSVIERSGRVYHVDADRDGSCKEVENYSHINVLMDLGAMDIYQRLGKDELDFVVLTEDGTVNGTAGRYNPKKDFLNPIIKSSIKDKSANYEILSYKGCKNIDNAVLLAELIRISTNGTKVIIHRDRDFMTEEDVIKIKKHCKNAGAIPFVTQGSDIESYYLKKEHLMHALQIGEREFDEINEDIKQKRVNNEDKIIKKIAADRFHSIKEELSLDYYVNQNSHEVYEYAEKIFRENQSEFLYTKEEFKNLINFVGRDRIKDILSPSPYLNVDIFKELN